MACARVHLFAAFCQTDADYRQVPGNDTCDTSSLMDSGTCNYSELSRLHVACVRGYHDTVCYLVQMGADINSFNHDGKSSLYLSCEYGHRDIVEFLLNEGADVNLCNKDGANPLHIAFQQGHNDIINVLNRYGADINKTINYLNLKTSKLNNL